MSCKNSTHPNKLDSNGPIFARGTPVFTYSHVVYTYTGPDPAFCQGGVQNWLMTGGTTEYTHLDKLQLIWTQQFQIYFSIKSFFLSSFFPFFKGVPTPETPLGSAHDVQSRVSS